MLKYVARDNECGVRFDGALLLPACQARPPAASHTPSDYNCALSLPLSHSLSLSRSLSLTLHSVCTDSVCAVCAICTNATSTRIEYDSIQSLMCADVRW